MERLQRVWIVVAALGWGLSQLAWPGAAHAGIGACGDIHVEASAQCEVVPPSVSCKAMCKPVAIRAACSGQLSADCRGGCPELPSVECSGECTADCETECEVDPGDFDCGGSCNADCSGRCSASCAAESDKAACEATCEGSCSASCDASCEGQPPEVDCEGSCEASCEGSCEADANLECQLDCQAMAQGDCEADVQGGCEADCEGDEGALFCDGQYVDSGDNLAECVKALRAALDIEVEGHAEGSSECTTGDGCRAEGRATANVSSDCSVTEPGTQTGGIPALFGVTALVALCRLRRQRIPM